MLLYDVYCFFYVVQVVLTKDERGKWSANESALQALALLNEVRQAIRFLVSPFFRAQSSCSVDKDSAVWGYLYYY